MKNATCLAIAFVVLNGSVFPAFGGQGREMLSPEEVSISSREALPHDWACEVGTGVQWSNVRVGGQDSYTLIPGTLTAALKLDDVSLDEPAWGIVRGYSEFLFQGYGTALTLSPTGASRIFGFNVGPRYNFVQPGWKWVPYVQGLVGMGFADSNALVDKNGTPHGLGEDTNFSFGVGVGVRYDFNESWYLRAGAAYTHYSNAGLSEPSHPNRPIDALGPMIAVGFRL